MIRVLLASVGENAAGALYIVIVGYQERLNLLRVRINYEDSDSPCEFTQKCYLYLP